MVHGATEAIARRHYYAATGTAHLARSLLNAQLPYADCCCRTGRSTGKHIDQDPVRRAAEEPHPSRPNLGDRRARPATVGGS